MCPVGAVTDPYEEVSRMMELPDLYTQFYDPSCALIQTFNQGSAANISQVYIIHYYLYFPKCQLANSLSILHSQFHKKLIHKFI